MDILQNFSRQVSELLSPLTLGNHFVGVYSALSLHSVRLLWLKLIVLLLLFNQPTAVVLMELGVYAAYLVFLRRFSKII